MRILKILLFIFFISCNAETQVENSNNISFEVGDTTYLTDSTLVELKYHKGVWEDYFRPIRTILGHIIRFKIITDSSYVIQWGDSSNYQVFPDTFELDGHSSRIPRYIVDTKDYIVLRKGCGNPCWIGYFLPMNSSIKPKTINEYLDFDLDNHLVVSIEDANTIQIMNLKTNAKEKYILNGCNSTFLGYCLDSLSIENKVLKYNWIPKNKIDSKEFSTKIKNIKI